MTTFTNGPAASATLWLKRAPLFLRVTKGPTGEFDALDQLSDTPKADEAIFAYRRVGRSGSVHINARKNGRHCGGFFTTATYEIVPIQPDDATMRDTAKWREWCVEHKPT